MVRVSGAVTYCQTRACTAFVTDDYARKIVGWKVATEVTQKLVTDAINHAIDIGKHSGTTSLESVGRRRHPAVRRIGRPSAAPLRHVGTRGRETAWPTRPPARRRSPRRAYPRRPAHLPTQLAHDDSKFGWTHSAEIRRWSERYR